MLVSFKILITVCKKKEKSSPLSPTSAPLAEDGGDSIHDWPIGLPCARVHEYAQVHTLRRIRAAPLAEDGGGGDARLARTHTYIY